MIRFDLSNSLIASWITFHQTKDLLQKVVDRAFADAPVTNEEYKVLLTIKNHLGPTSQVDIAKWLSRSPNTISVLLARMEGKGLLVRTRDTDDRRVVHVALTPKGEQLYWKASVVAWDMVSKVMGGLVEEERRTLTELLGKVQEGVSGFLGNGDQSPEVVALDDVEQMALLEQHTAAASVLQAENGQDSPSPPAMVGALTKGGNSHA